MAEEYYQIPENPEYDIDRIRKLLNSDPGNAETVFNPIILRLLTNIAALKEILDAAGVDIGDALAAAQTANTAASKAQTTADTAKSTAAAALPKSGGTMTGALTLSGAPTANLHAASKQYVDAVKTTAETAKSTADTAKSTADAANTLATAVNTAIYAQKLALGGAATASGSLSIAIGNNVTASGINSVCIGRNSTATGEASYAIGINAKCNGRHSVALGTSSAASNIFTTALGEGAQATGEYSVAVSSAYARGEYSVAIGWATANGSSSTAIGRSSYVTGSNSTAIGFNSSEANNNSIRLGSTSLSGLYCAVSLTKTSDRRDKADISAIDGGAVDFLKRVTAIRYLRNPRESYYYDEEELDEAAKEKRAKYGLYGYDKEAHARGDKKGERMRVGVIAQEVQKALEEVYGDASYANLVNDNFFDYDPADIPEDVENRLGVSYENFIPFLIKAVQELAEQIEELKEGR